VNVLVAIGLAQGDATVLASGDDFYACARVSPDSRQLAWLSWNHPDMPWDGTRLWLAPLRADGTLGHAHCVAGGPDESIFQPSWSPQGELHFVSDRSGWWNLYRLRDAAVQPLLPMAAEFGAAQWAFAMSTYGHCDDGRIVCTYVQDGRSHLAVLAGDAEGLRTVPTPYCTISDVQVAGDNVVFIGTRVDQGAAIVRWNLALGTGQTLRESSPSDLPAAWVSVAQPLAYATTGGATAHAFYYPPTHPHLRGADGERAPLLVMTHGGPTGSTDAGLRWPVQYWTSRGFGVVDVNYRGSTGYGRAYRRALDGRWGVLDVDDAIAAASHLIERGDADPHRVAIRGSSAGGYTTLCALTFHDFFSAGASHYGIGDLEALARDTHKFESRYLDRLIGPYPQAAALYRQRSPIHHTDRLSRPMILFQGVQDRVVPPAQAEAMFAAVRARGLPVAYLLFDGEEHGFRRAENIMRALEAELYFYGRVFGFAPADAIEPVEIWNLAPGAG
jgi:dipeptidyl aminopeptidase/acylaminoacyl peptidase